MVITATSAASMATFSALQGVSPDAPLSSLFLMTCAAGMMIVLAGSSGWDGAWHACLGPR